jgi:hypothetical protein
MVGRRISETQRWQIIGMHTTGMSFKAIGRQMGYRYTVVSRLVRTHTQTNNVKDLPRSGRPGVTSDRDDRAFVLIYQGVLNFFPCVYLYSFCDLPCCFIPIAMHVIYPIIVVTSQHDITY